jgi:predicted ATPase
MPPPDLGSALDRLTAAGLLFGQGVPPHATYLFKHALVQDAAYGTLLREPRRALHARIAQALEDQFTEITESQPELLAHHLTECGRLEEAVAAWERAGDRAVSRSAFVEGVAHFRRGVEVLETFPATTARARRLVGIHLKLGGPLTATRGYNAPAILDHYSRTRDLCEEIGDTRGLFNVLEGLWIYHYVNTDMAIARELGDQLLAMADRTRDGAHLLSAHTALGCTTTNLGELATAREHMEQALAHHDPERHINLMTAWGADPGVIALGYQVGGLTALGYPEQGFAAAQRALALARVQPHSFSMAWGLQSMAFAYLSRGAMAEALETADALVTLSREQGFPHWHAQGMILHAAAASWLDSPAKAIPLLKDAIAARVAAGSRISHAAFSLNLVSACLRAGEVETGLAVVTELFAHVERTGDRVGEPYLWLRRGQLLLATVNADETEAELSMQKALSVSRLQGHKLAELAAATALTQLWLQQGKRGAALELLAPIYGWFTEGFEFPVLRDARALLCELSKP